MRPPDLTTSLPNRFWRQWWATAVSNLGDGINFAALPLLAYSLTDDERLLSLTAFVTLVPWLVLALPVGVLVDHADRRILMVVANVVRVGLFGVIAVTAGADSITVVVLMSLLVGVGTCEVVFDSSAQAFLPTLVSSADLPRANGYLFAVEVVAGSILGLSVGAFLFDRGHALPFAVNAASFAIAAVLIASIRVERRSRPLDVSELGASIGSALRSLWDDRLLRLLAIMLTVTNFGLMFGHGIFVKYADRELGVTGFGYGLLLVATALGAAGAGVFGHRMIARLGTRWSIIVPYLAFGVTQMMLGAVPVTAVVAVVGFVLGASITMWNVVTVTIRQRLIEPAQFGRVNSVYRWIGTGAGAFGALVGGQLAYATNLRVPYIAAGAITLAALALLAPPLLRGTHDVDMVDHARDLTPAPPSIT
ncbi:MAG TPA: MFS transporter [Ilumatobacteraceae bacterium]|nr:MFS transporter [Ilumatobacteraceae bacterium]